MIRYIIKRMLLMLLVALGVVLFVFIVSRAGGDPVATILGDQYTQEEYDTLYHDLGFDQPYVVQFFNYISQILHGDLGTSYISKASVAKEITMRFPISIRIAVFSMLFSVPIGLIIGLISAIKQNTTWDYVLNGSALLLNAIPGFWAALMMMLLFSLKLNLLPATGLDTWKGYILPCIAVGLHPMTYMARLSRSSFLEVINQDYIRTARSKGLRERAVIFKHALPNAAIPVITQISNNFAIVVGSSAVIENIFMVPGVGNYLAYSITVHDYPSVQGAVLFFSIFVSLVNLVVDILYAFVDPRIKANYVGR